MEKLKELQPLILEWAKEKDLLKLENAPKQRLKLLEEVGETAGAILKNNTDDIKDGIGDMFVVLVILNAQIDSDLEFDIDGFEKSKETDIYEILKNIAFVNNGSLYSELSVLNDACNFSTIFCSSSVSLLPISHDAKPHCGLKDKRSRGIYLLASLIL